MTKMGRSGCPILFKHYTYVGKLIGKIGFGVRGLGI